MNFFTSPEIIPFIGAFVIGIICIISVKVYAKYYDPYLNAKDE